MDLYQFPPIEDDERSSKKFIKKLFGQSTVSPTGNFKISSFEKSDFQYKIIQKLLNLL